MLFLASSTGGQDYSLSRTRHCRFDFCMASGVYYSSKFPLRWHQLPNWTSSLPKCAPWIPTSHRPDREEDLQGVRCPLCAPHKHSDSFRFVLPEDYSPEWLGRAVRLVPEWCLEQKLDCAGSIRTLQLFFPSMSKFSFVHNFFFSDLVTAAILDCAGSFGTLQHFVDLYSSSNFCSHGACSWRACLNKKTHSMVSVKAKYHWSVEYFVVFFDLAVDMFTKKCDCTASKPININTSIYF